MKAQQPELENRKTWKSRRILKTGEQELLAQKRVITGKHCEEEKVPSRPRDGRGKKCLESERRLSNQSSALRGVRFGSTNPCVLNVSRALLGCQNLGQTLTVLAMLITALRIAEEESPCEPENWRERERHPQFT
jgi:hypothetical protein